MGRVFVVFVISFGLLATACQSRPVQATRNAAIDVRDATTTTRDGISRGVEGAVRAPARDLNIERKEIPPKIKALQGAYLEGIDFTCQQIADEILALTVEIGLDEDDLRHQPGASRGTRAGKAASEAALDAVEGFSSGIIPFRGVVRRVSGAHAYEKRYRAATLTGLKRRAYLKGIGAVKGCLPPAAPLPPPPPIEDEQEN